MIFYGQYSCNKYTGRRNELCQRRTDPHLQAGKINYTAQHTGQRIDIFTEYQRHLVNQDVTDHTAESSRDRPHHDSHPHGKTEGKRFLDTDHAKQTKPDRVE